MFRTGDIQAERNPHFCVHRMEMGGTPRSGRYKSELLHRVETSEGAFSRQLVGLFGICSGDTTDRISNRCCSPFWTLIPRIVRYHPLPTFPFQSLSRLLWISLSAGAVCGVQLGRRRQPDSPRRAEAVIESVRRAEAVIDSPRRAEAVIDSPPARRHIGALPSGLPGVAALGFVGRPSRSRLSRPA